MKNITKKITRVCMVVGYYDENSHYRELTYDNMRLRDIHKSIRRNIDQDHDITLHVVPGIEVRVFAKSSKDIEEFLGIKKNPDYCKGMLDAWSKYNRSENGEYIYTTFDLEEVRSLTNCS